MRLEKGIVGMCLGVMLGCGGGGSGPATFQVKATGTGVPAAQSAAGLVGFTTDGVDFTLTEARVNLREIRLALADGKTCADVSAEVTAPATCADSDGSAEIRIAGPILVDLLAGTSSPDLGALRIPAGTYRRVEFRVDDTEASQGLASDDPLSGMSFEAAAAFTDQGFAKQLKLALNFNEDHRLEPSGGVPVSGEGGQLLLVLDAQQWLSGIPVASCLTAGDLATDGDTVFLDERSGGSCSDVENVLKDNIKGSEQLDAR